MTDEMSRIVDQLENPCETCIYNHECSEDDMDYGCNDGYECYNEGRY